MTEELGKKLYWKKIHEKPIKMINFFPLKILELNPDCVCETPAYLMTPLQGNREGAYLKKISTGF